MNMSKLRKKHNRYRSLKTLSYLLGFPLLILLVLIGSMSLFEGDAFSDTKWYGVIVCVAIWAVSVVLQIVISLITKSYNGRTLFMLIVSLVLLVGGSVFFDLYAEGKIDDINEEYAAHGVQVDSYKYQAGWVVTWTDRDGLANKYVDDVNRFCAVYNIGYKSSNYGKVNGDGSEITYDKDADAYYSPNGMYADGYIFGFKQAVQVLIDYNQSKFDIENDWQEAVMDGDKIKQEAQFVANGKDADEELAKALAALDTDSKWLAYKNSAEYKAAYGDDGTAYKFMLNAERLDNLIRALAKGLSKTTIFDKLANLGINVDSLLSNFGIKVDDLKNLTLDSAIELINGMGLFEEEVSEEMLLDLMQSFSYYQSPTVKPKFAFIEDETLRTYAYANYYGTVHGANVGSVLVAKDDGKPETIENIGHVTMDSSGYPADRFAYTLTELYELQARDAVANPYYALMMARRYMMLCSGIVAVMSVLFYHFKRKERDIAEVIDNAVQGGGY